MLNKHPDVIRIAAKTKSLIASTIALKMKKKTKDAILDTKRTNIKLFLDTYWMKNYRKIIEDDRMNGQNIKRQRQEKA